MTSARTHHGPAPIEWPGERHEQKGLKDLYTTGTKLSEVDPAFEGIAYPKWQMLKITEQCSELSLLPAPEKNKKWVGNKSVATPRDGYGMKGVR